MNETVLRSVNENLTEQMAPQTALAQATGVGLTIVEQLVRAHDGEIDVDSSVGRGSRFRVFLEHTESATVEQD